MLITKETQVNQLMETNLVTASPEVSIYDVAKLMDEKKVGTVLIVDKDKKLLGIVTDRDIVTKTIAKRKYMTTSLVKEIMQTNPTTISPETTCKEALKIMSKHSYRRLPIESGGKLIGIISIADLVQKTELDTECIENIMQELSCNVKINKEHLLKA